ncbi:MAG: phosphoglycolate phosphatase [Paracoccus sp. (in: a-proteobacteria)]|nr:phosphoglycolate phosphatase [Paracoccus sp. (in: a-proteobacteria)]
MNVIFDLDGTLIDSVPDIHAASNAALADEGLGALDLATVRGFVGRGVPHLIACMMKAHGIDDPRTAARVQAGLMARYDEAVTLTRMFDGVPGALTRLRDDGHVLAICTNKPAAPAHAVLRHLGLDGFFGVVIGGDSGLARKPDPAPLNHTLTLMPPGRAIFVGDSEIDAATAAAAGMPFLLYTEGYRKAPAGTLPHHALFSDFAILPRLVASCA